MPALQHLPANAKPKAIVNAINEDGACIIDNLIAPGDLAALNAELGALYRSDRAWPR